MLSGLVGKDVAVSPGCAGDRRAEPPGDRRDLHRARHVDQRAVRDGPRRLGVHRGRAGPAAARRLRRTPSRRTSELSPLLLEALHEVVNVLSALFNTPGAPHSKLHKLVRPRRGRARRHRRHARRLQPARPGRRGPRLRQGRAVASSCRNADIAILRTAAASRSRRAVTPASRLRPPGSTRATTRASCAQLSAHRPRVAGGRASGQRRFAVGRRWAGRPTRAWRRRRRTSRAPRDSRATRCRPMPPWAGSRSTAGAGIDSGARSLTSSSQPPLPATTVATTGDSPCRSALDASSSKARISCSPAAFSPSGGNPTSPSRPRRPARAAGSSASAARFQRHTSPRPSGSGRNGHASRPIVLAPRVDGNARRPR